MYLLFFFINNDIFDFLLYIITFTFIVIIKLTTANSNQKICSLSICLPLTNKVYSSETLGNSNKILVIDNYYSQPKINFYSG